ncbi:MAG: class I SAM-dependent methyltransferase [Nocardiopsaceae bacterium]|nr:class I SAM-dependent methyltransferase [Nocardiopsaceae bacterium]
MTVSKTSQAVAMTRSGFARPHSAQGDPLAQQRLCAGMNTVVLTHMLASLAARTAFFDGQVTSAIEAGVDQIVILGAGYDDRALRFRSSGVTFFEVDHSGTQTDKRMRLDAILAEDEPASDAPRPVLVAADFGSDDVAAVLRAAGHDRQRVTLFICEGLLVYLDRPTTVRFLSGVRSAAAHDSLLAASLSVHADGLDSATVVARGNARRRTAEAEPWQTILPVSGQIALLASAGWDVAATVDAADLGTGAEPGRSLLVTAAPAG